MTVYEEKAIVAREGKKHGVNPEVIWGIYGNETAFGKNQTTSSAGAKGPTQFIESTAKAFGYPYTNEKTKPIFEKQIAATASYLQALLHMSGTKGAPAYEYAISHYSGGEYSYQKVLQTANAHPLGAGAHEGEKNEFNPVEKTYEEAKKTYEGAEKGLGSIGGFFEALGEAKTWLRVAEGIGGLVLIYLGLAELTKTHPVGRALSSDVRFVYGKVK